MIEDLPPQIESILAAGNLAPSGENCQPWRFVVKGMHIDIYCLSERDGSYYNWGQRASYMAIGAAAENMVIAATAVGYKADVTFFQSNEPDHVASIDLTLNPGIARDVLESMIFLRVTNRKKFLPLRLSDRELKPLTDAVDGTNNGSLHLVHDRNEIKRLAQVGAANEEIMLSNQVLHSFFFNHINWTKEEDQKKKMGFYIKSLELPIPALAAFYVLRYWNVMEQLTQLGIQKAIGSQNAATYAATGAMGAITIPDDNPASFANAGRAMERMWLVATQLGMSIQPLTGILFFKLKMDGGEGQVFSSEHQARIEEQYKAAQKIFDCSGKRIAFMFRLGSGATPSAHSSRFPLREVVTILPS